MRGGVQIRIRNNIDSDHEHVFLKLFFDASNEKSAFLVDSLKKTIQQDLIKNVISLFQLDSIHTKMYYLRELSFKLNFYFSPEFHRPFYWQACGIRRYRCFDNFLSIL